MFRAQLEEATAKVDAVNQECHAAKRKLLDVTKRCQKLK